MVNFSKKERLIASFLSATPGLKQIIKKIYIQINAIIYRKGYIYKILSEEIHEIKNPLSGYNKEFFCGYYDKYSINNEGILLACLTSCKTQSVPSAKEPIQIIAINIYNGSIVKIGNSSAYNWQQGSRAQWLSKDKVIYNVFQDGKFKAVVYSLSQRKELKRFDYPVQDAYKTDYFLSVNYRRIMSLRPDYGYRNLPPLSIKEMNELSGDGIWLVNYENETCCLLHSLVDIIQCNPQKIFSSCSHKINHVMINKYGDGFIFIHRFYMRGRRFDRLLYSDFKSLKLLVDEGMVSHCCWVDEYTVLGYFRYRNKDGYYYCDVHTGEIEPCWAMTNLGVGDGHPSCHGDWIVFDSYPDKSRMQHLFLFNRKTSRVIPLLELYHGTLYSGESRCDLHPRFSEDGRYVSFDSIYLGKRGEYYIDISNLLNNK